ncbi:UTP--glucose-1-phosphate uridylyltransferase-like [Sycon ciliatum]|uniref:UTP--glucose-1-phosphate uridylyltransferase-like n=1 Tax=Sycon ciliatum TaxID=27933 RepID=UPI0020AB4DCA|eukprot:scpid66001/ scgid34608/ UTP--glucose-1-phosphate uridylyltransferase; UDP-glucose pyrophosphorylase
MANLNGRADAKEDAIKDMEREIAEIKQKCPAEQKKEMETQLEGFQRLFKRFLSESGPSVHWEDVKPAGEKMQSYSDLPDIDPENIDVIRKYLEKLVVLKLNGGLGTSMGCKGPKSLIAVRGEHTFLDLTVQQIEALNKKYNVSVPLVLMNSFNTHVDTQKILWKYHGTGVPIFTFQQSCYPRINRESLMPMDTNLDSKEAWYPPGHGDFYEAFYNSSYLTKFIEQGKEFVFVSNIDNLGANVDINILSFLLSQPAEKRCEFVTEVTDKTRADIKGGTLIDYQGKLRLLEIAQVPKDHIDEFTSISKFKIFNTNNMWINLAAIKRLTEAKAWNMEIIRNEKTTDSGTRVIQLETAAGAAIKHFDGATGINVPRRRFLPVKLTSDLLLVMSNLYTIHQGTLSLSEKRQFPGVPLIKLGQDKFKKVKDFLQRFATIPDLLELDHLTVSGDVSFGKGVTLKGTVIIIAHHGERIDIAAGSILENKIVSGNLRIVDH